MFYEGFFIEFLDFVVILWKEFRRIGLWLFLVKDWYFILGFRRVFFFEF